MGQFLSKQDGHQRLPSVTAEREKVALEPAEEPDLLRGMSISPARFQRQAELSQKDGLQRNPGPEGYADEELLQWDRVLKGRRLFEDGEPISLQGIRQNIQCWELIMKGDFGGHEEREEAPEGIRQANEELRQEAHMPRSENDYDCEELPVKSFVEGIYERSHGFYWRDWLCVNVNEKGIVTSVRKG